MGTFTLSDNIDIFTGTPDDDSIDGRGGDDQIHGGGGNDTIDGGDGNDFLWGDDGNDTLLGGPGDDVLTGGPGIDILTGGPGVDAFRDTAAGLNGDTITDLQIGDRIQILDRSPSDIGLTGSAITFNGGSVTINDPEMGRLIVRPIEGGGVEIRREEIAHNDFNGDGLSDVLLRYTNGTLIDWLGQGSGTFFSNHGNATYALDIAWQVAGTSDFNGDGRADVLLRNDDGTITEWLGQANGSFTWNSSATYGLDPGWKVVGTGDFNGDGRGDVLLRYSNGTIIDWLGRSDGTFSSNHANATYALPTGWNVAGTGDFNGDGRDDILLRNDDGTITEWLGQANGSFTWNSSATYGLDPGWKVVGTGDFNGDGLGDVLLRYSNGTVIDWLGRSDGTFASNHANATYALDPTWHVVQTGDFNGDAVDDVLLRNDNGSITEWLGQANGSFNWNAPATYDLATAWHVQPAASAFA